MALDWNELPRYLLSAAAGFGIGLFYYGGLWWTVRRLPDLQRPGLFFALSFLVRTLVAVGAIYLATRGRLDSLVACMVGFVIVRFWLVRRWGPHSPVAKGAREVSSWS